MLNSDQIKAFLEQHYRICKVSQIEPLVSYCDFNFKIVDAERGDFVLKISNIEEQRQQLEFENSVLGFLHANGFAGRIPEVVPGSNGDAIQALDFCQHHVRLITWLNGTPFASESLGKDKVYKSTTAQLAKLDRLLQNFQAPGMHRTLSWDPAQFISILPLIAGIADLETRTIAKMVMQRFRSDVLLKMQNLRRSVIHGDGNEANLLSMQGGQIGVIDFGDMLCTQTICELAIHAAYVLMQSQDIIKPLICMAQTYHEFYPLEAAELEVLFDLIAVRCVISLAHSTQSAQQDPDNEYCLQSQEPARELLKKWLQKDAQQVGVRLKEACGLQESYERPWEKATHAKGKESLQKKRAKILFSPLSLSYQPTPLHLVRGQLQYLIDENNQAYLDTVNNVAHLGHCHPEVEEALYKQLSILNTNTRYLHQQRIEYCEHLLSYFDPHLERVALTCSGSEANDLALRILTLDGQRPVVVVMEGGYHGSTWASSALSHYKFARLGMPVGGVHQHAGLHILTLPLPPSDLEDLDQDLEYKKKLLQAFAKIDALGKPLAGFFCESILSCGGQKPLPKGFLNFVYALVRSRGGFCVADEVQVGFGRSGQHMWAYEQQHITPDAVVLGKPMGNGHPLAGLVLSAELDQRYASLGLEYFNTFAGNPVACAAGEAVLQVMERDQLMEHAEEVGAFFGEELARLQKGFPHILRQIRGQGLFLGVEFLPEFHGKFVTEVVQFLLCQRILASQDGLKGEVIKIKPPLLFQKEQVKDYTLALQNALETL